MFGIPAATYILIGYASYAEFVFRRNELNLPVTFFGVLIFLAGILLRRQAMSALHPYWSLYTEPHPSGHLVTDEIYQFMRHPYYASVVFELSGFCLILNSFISFALVVLIQLPLVLIRVKYEDGQLLKKYGNDYEFYKSKTRPISLPGISWIKNTHLYQLLHMIRIVGFSGVIRILVVHKRLRRYSRPYMTFYSLMTLSNLGLIEQMKRSQYVRLNEFADTKSCSLDDLTSLCDYLYQVKLLEHNERGYKLSREGSLLTNEAMGAFNMLYAYAPYFENLDSVVSGKSSDIGRRERFMSKGSSALSMFLPIPSAKEIIIERGFKRIADLGCGDAQFLIYLSKHVKGFEGIGVDISKSIVDQAIESVSRSEGSQSINIIQGDITKPQSLITQMQPMELFCMMFVLHEFFKKDFKEGTEIITGLAKAFPKKHYLICELTRLENADLRRLGSSVSEHHLFHRLSDQGLLSRSEWRSIFRSSGLKIIDETHFDFAAQSYFLVES